MTPAEERLWAALRRNQQKGFYFRRQHPIDRFVVDFCCTRAKLCIEVDGGVHDRQQEHDAERVAWLEAAGYRVLRFRNEEVEEALHLVVRHIKAVLHASSDARERDAGTREVEVPEHRQRHTGPGLLDIPLPDARE
jgi:very-short-patch-repair endonuclease